jgi:hypothetical protein
MDWENWKMSLAFVSQRAIGDQIYTAYRDIENPRNQFIERGGDYKPCRIRDVWATDHLIEALWR